VRAKERRKNKDKVSLGYKGKKKDFPVKGNNEINLEDFVFNVGGSRISEQGAQNRNNAQGT
jgi:hypothetical protein